MIPRSNATYVHTSWNFTLADQLMDDFMDAVTEASKPIINFRLGSGVITNTTI